jgi:hypothetical protein
MATAMSSARISGRRATGGNSDTARAPSQAPMAAAAAAGPTMGQGIVMRRP